MRLDGSLAKPFPMTEGPGASTRSATRAGRYGVEANR
jgi:hypothetical protein